MLDNPLTETGLTPAFHQADLLWFCLYLAAFLFAAHVLIVAYHWFTFGTSQRLSTLAVVIYLGVGGLLLGGAAAIIIFST